MSHSGGVVHDQGGPSCTGDTHGTIELLVKDLDSKTLWYNMPKRRTFIRYCNISEEGENIEIPKNGDYVEFHIERRNIFGSYSEVKATKDQHQHGDVDGDHHKEMHCSTLIATDVKKISGFKLTFLLQLVATAGIFAAIAAAFFAGLNNLLPEGFIFIEKFAFSLIFEFATIFLLSYIIVFWKGIKTFSGGASTGFFLGIVISIVILLPNFILDAAGLNELLVKSGLIIAKLGLIGGLTGLIYRSKNKGFSTNERDGGGTPHTHDKSKKEKKHRNPVTTH